jgi:hypothetical protein
MHASFNVYLTTCFTSTSLQTNMVHVYKSTSNTYACLHTYKDVCTVCILYTVCYTVYCLQPPIPSSFFSVSRPPAYVSYDSLSLPSPSYPLHLPLLPLPTFSFSPFPSPTDSPLLHPPFPFLLPFPRPSPSSSPSFPLHPPKYLIPFRLSNISLISPPSPLPPSPHSPFPRPLHTPELLSGVFFLLFLH